MKIDYHPASAVTRLLFTRVLFTRVLFTQVWSTRVLSTAAVLLLAACSEGVPEAPDAAARLETGPVAGQTTPGTPHAAEPGATDDAARHDPAWIAELEAQVQRIDDATAGELGVYVSRIGSSQAMAHQAGRDWYLASTIKVPVAIAVLEQVDAGSLSLDQELPLRQTDFVDGAGDLIWQEPGGTYSIGALIEKSLRNSDSTATDMLIRLIGEDHLNRRIQSWVGGGFGPVTTILQVRYDVYGALHPGVKDLTNMQIVSLRQADAGESRLHALARLLGVERAELDTDGFEQAFERYYATGSNSARPAAFADMLEQLAAGELLSPDSTRLLLDHMRAITTGDTRIKAGLPADLDFAQKTGTQIGRACNVGVLATQDNSDDAPRFTVVACASGFGAIGNAERAFSEIGRALASTLPLGQ